MSNVIAIIDSAYGDSGKGLMTDYFSSQYNDAVVIRSNGGAQAGHTVVTPDGKRHVFSHFGAGTFNGSPTFLSSFFVSNPILFRKEYELFVKEFGIEPKIYIDPESIITTPFDMLLNQSLELMRGDDAHGSCGVGFGETLERKLTFSHLTVNDLLTSYNLSKDVMLNRLLMEQDAIREDYIPTRINMDNVGENFLSILYNDKVMYDFVDDCKFMLQHIEVVDASYFENNTLIFEGAQGLLLDMDYGYFPHVTRSNCGMKNISEILKTIPGEHDVTVNYVTRAYTTRHGAGPLDDERPAMPEYYDIVDETNIPNQFQGELRFGILDSRLMQSITDKDFLNYAPRGAKRAYTITCLDQLNEDGMEAIEDFTMKRIRFQYKSYGPTRKDIKDDTVRIS